MLACVVNQYEFDHEGVYFFAFSYNDRSSTRCLAHDDHDEHRSTAVALLHELAPVLGRDLCCSFVGHELVAMRHVAVG